MPIWYPDDWIIHHDGGYFPTLKDGKRSIYVNASIWFDIPTQDSGYLFGTEHYLKDVKLVEVIARIESYATARQGESTCTWKE